MTVHLNWAVTNTPTVAPTDYQIEELVAGAWAEVAMVTAGQAMPYNIAGRAVGSVYTFRVTPYANGVRGTPSNQTSCGALPSDATLNITCTTSVIP